MLENVKINIRKTHIIHTNKGVKMDIANFLDLKGFNFVCVDNSIRDGKRYKTITLESNQKRPACPNCGSLNCYVNQTRPKLVRDLDICGSHVELKILTRSFKCNDCNKTYTEVHDIVAPYLSSTTRLRNKIGADALNLPFETVAEIYDVSKTVVKNNFDKWVAEQDAQRSNVITAPRILGIDEAHLCPEGNKINDGMRGVFVDIENRRLIDITRDRKKDTVVDWLKKLKDPENLEIVTIDMWDGYKAAVYDTCDAKVKVVVDHYHIIQELEIRMMECRSKISESYPAGTFSKHKNYQSLLKSNIEDLNNKMREMLMRLFNKVPELKTCYGLKESFRSIYELTDRKKAEEAFEIWCKQIPDDERFKPYRAFEKTVRSWHTEIFNFFDCERFTNAATESLNNIIKKVNRQGNGYSFDILRAKILYGAGRTKSVRQAILNTKQTQTAVSNQITTVHCPIDEALEDKLLSTLKELDKRLSLLYTIDLNELENEIDEGLLDERKYL